MNKPKQYKVGIYCRLSKDDLGGNSTGNGNGNTDSSSITSQRAMLEKYVIDNGLTVTDSYVDDGYSGTNFNRPEFQRLIEDIESGKINMVVAKDLSRLGRNYIQTGQYTDIYFPDRGVRFVALNDGIDSLCSDNDITPFRNILNQMYSNDLSKKVRSAVRIKKQRGEYLSNYAPYGYQKDSTDKNKLVIEESGAEVVRRIFNLCASGHGSPYIAKMLNRDSVLSPRNHRETVCHPNAAKHLYEWTPETVHAILRSQIYKGDMVQGRYNCARFKRTPSKIRPSSEWIITPKTHEAIIDDNLWYYVQKCLDVRKRVVRTGEVQLFSGFIRCADCGYALSYARRFGTEYYSCGLYRRRGIEYCTGHYIKKQTLSAVVLDDIKRYAQVALDDTSGFALQLAEQNSSQEIQNIKSKISEIKSAEKRSTEIDLVIEQLYEDKIAGNLSNLRFQKLSDKYESEQQVIEKQVSILRSEVERLERSKRDVSAWTQLIKKYAAIEELDRVILGELVEKITVGETKIVDGTKCVEVTIYYRFIGAVGL